VTLPETLRIGLDVDGVLADYMSGIAGVGRVQGHPMHGRAAGPTTYGLVEPGWFPDTESASAAMAQLRDTGGLGRLQLLDPGAPAAVRKLRAAGHRVVVVTARGAQTRRDTVSWLRRHGIEADEVRFHAIKSEAGCHAYLDDAPHIVDELRGAGRFAFVYDAPYNRHVAGPRVSRIAEFAERLLDPAFDLSTFGCSQR